MQTKQTKDQLRQGIFSGAQFKKTKIKIWGNVIEFRQPTLKKALDVDGTQTSGVIFINMMIDQAYVPGTNDKVFTEGDREALEALPFDSELNKMVTVLGDLTGNAADAEKN